MTNIYNAIQAFRVGAISMPLPIVSKYGDKYASDLALFHFITGALRVMTGAELYLTNTGALKTGIIHIHMYICIYIYIYIYIYTCIYFIYTCKSVCVQLLCICIV
jgi:hypothetical protein